MNARTKVLYRRSHRHRANHKLKNKASVRPHRRIAGKTGSIHAKRTRSSRHVPLHLVFPNP